MKIDDSIRFALKEFLYRNSYSCESLGARLGIQGETVEQWLNASSNFIKPGIWLSLYIELKAYIKNPKIAELTELDKKEYDKIEKAKGEICKRISKMDFEEVCKKYTMILQFISQKYRFDYENLNLPEPVYREIIEEKKIPSFEQLEVMCKAWNLPTEVSFILGELVDRMNNEVVTKIISILDMDNLMLEELDDRNKTDSVLEFMDSVGNEDLPQKTYSFH